MTTKQRQIKTLAFVGAALLTSTINAQSTAEFENFGLPVDSAIDAQIAVADDTTFQSSNFIFPSSGGGGWWTAGWAISSKTDTVDGTYTNLYSARPGYGQNSATYAVGQQSSSIKIEGSSKGKLLNGMYVTNTNYAAETMRLGNLFSKKFGGDSLTDPDWFLLTIKGYNGGVFNDSIDFYLADFRSSNPSEDYILTDWAWVDLSGLGNVDSLTFTLNSSDVGDWGINTPTFFCIDNLQSTDQSLSVKTSEQSAVSVFPNPADNGLSVSGLELNSSIEIRSSNGTLVKQTVVNSSLVQLDLSELTSGVYFLSILSNGNQEVKRFIKR